MNALTRKRPIPLGGIELLDLLIVHDGTHHHRGLVGGQGRIRGLVDRTVDLYGRRETARNEQIRAVALHHLAQQVLCQAYRLFTFHLSISSAGRRAT
jgi:hypothetical protein